MLKKSDFLTNQRWSRCFLGKQINFQTNSPMACTYIDKTQVNFLKHSGHCLWYFSVGEWMDPPG